MTFSYDARADVLYLSLKELRPQDYMVTENEVGTKCLEPEETIKSLVGNAIQEALKVFPATAVVKVDASGSQSQVDYKDPSKGITNQLSVSIQPLWGFVE